MGIFEAETRLKTVGDLQFLSNRFGEWAIAREETPTLIQRDPSDYRIRLEKRLGHLRGGPIEFNIQVPEWNSENVSLVKRFLDLARLTTGTEIFIEWEITDCAHQESLVQFHALAQEHFENLGKPVLQSAMFPVELLAEIPLPGLDQIVPHGTPDEWMVQSTSTRHDSLQSVLQPVVKLTESDIPEGISTHLSALGAETFRFVPFHLFHVHESPPIALPSNLASFIRSSAEQRGIRERTTGEMMCRMLNGREPKRAFFSSPGKGCVRTLALDRVGNVFASRTGRLIAETLECEEFLLGHIISLSYHDAVTHPIGRALILASHLETQPGWHSDAYTPFLGIDPVLSFAETGSLHGNWQRCSQTNFQSTLLDGALEGLLREKRSSRETLEDWGNLPEAL